MTLDKKRPVLEFEIPGKAVPLKSPRIFYDKRRGKYRGVVPQEVKDWQANIIIWSKVGTRKQRWRLTDNAVILDVEIGIQRKSNQKNWKYPETKPDRTNLLKPIEDALEGIVYTNDSRIVDGRVTKVFADYDYVRIKVVDLEG